MKKLNKKEIKSYSNQILKTCKLAGYDPSQDDFEIFFGDDGCFDFIPCIRDGIDSCVDDDELEEFMEKLGKIIDEIIDNNDDVELTSEEIEAFANEHHKGLGEYVAIRTANDTEDIINWILDNCDKQTKEKFLNWAFE